MIIKKIEINNFRNIKNIVFSPFKEINIISGENAQGKTNLIEAIWFFTGAKSFRGIKNAEAIKKGEEKANLKLTFINNNIENTAEIEIFDKSSAKLNGKNLKMPSSLAGEFYAVVFSPDDLNIVCGSPSVRRRFIDIAIGQLYPKYIDILREYTRAVKQRNNILKESIKDGSLLFLIEDFEKIIAKEGEKIINYRKRYLELLNEKAVLIYSGISDKKEKLKIEYQSTVNENLLKELEERRNNDRFSGVTTVGPHRDDIIFSIDNLNSRDFASQGQKRSIALSLKLAEAEIIKEKTDRQPVILLDDVMSELDKKRQNYILNKIKGVQVFITCCDEENFSSLEKGNIIRIKNGEII